MEGFNPCACLPNWVTDITDCSLKHVCADCKQRIPEGHVGFYFSLFIPCTEKLGQVHVYAGHVHEECTRTWKYEFEQMGHDNLCDRHPFTPDMIPPHLMMAFHMQCLSAHLPPAKKRELIEQTQRKYDAVRHCTSHMLQLDLEGVSQEQKSAMLAEAKRFMEETEKKLEILKRDGV